MMPNVSLKITLKCLEKIRFYLKFTKKSFIPLTSKIIKIMSKLAEAIETYVAQSNELGLGLSEELITAVAKGLGPSIYNADSSKVSGSDPDELARVKNNYLIGKLGLSDGPELDAAIAEVMEQMGTSNRNKYRANVYALLCKKFGKEGIYA
ncbi:hypothetical protein EMA8858_00380 [Emticicia aquatica]|jgi:hypothetical protein|uniref:DUF2853 family protein n=2 Tax=Emticicia aquatica TaxID=1681835 RepID=A0ABN8ER25_9BACT|nr:hypothetical protein EMA8858_00380 [Emticicia aquatica]